VLLGNSSNALNNPQIHWEECWAEWVVQPKMQAVGSLRVSSKDLTFYCLLAA